MHRIEAWLLGGLLLALPASAWRWETIQLECRDPYKSNLNAVTWTDSQFVAVGDYGSIFTSPDGTAWSAHHLDTEVFLTSVIGTRNSLVTVGYGPDIPAAIYTSPDGKKWKRRMSPVSAALWSVAWTGSRFVAVGNQGAIVTSQDGARWTSQKSGTKSQLMGVAWGNDLLIAVGWKSFLISRDGAMWMPTGIGEDFLFKKVVHSGDRFVILVFGGIILTFSNEDEWEQGRVTEAHSLYSAVQIEDRLLVGGKVVASPTQASRFILLDSKTGKDWSEVYTQEGGTALSMAWNGKRLVVVDAGRCSVLVGTP